MYYIIDEAVATSETGANFPQSEEMLEPYDYDSPLSVSNISYYKGTRIPFVPNFDSIKIKSRSKLTDVISVTAGSSTSDMLISKRFKELLLQYNLVECQFFDVKLNHKNTVIEGYEWLHLVSDMRTLVDFEKSRFAIPMQHITDDMLVFRNYETYIQFCLEHDPKSYLRSKEIYFINESKFDLFYISKFDQNIYISKLLRDVILENKITGLKIIDAPNIC